MRKLAAACGLLGILMMACLSKPKEREAIGTQLPSFLPAPLEEGNKERMQVYPLGTGEGLIAVSPELLKAAEKEENDGLHLLGYASLDELNEALSENQEFAWGVMAAILSGGIAAGLVKYQGKIQEKVDFLAVYQGWSKDVAIKTRVFQKQHTKNLQKNAKDPSSAFTVIDMSNNSKIYASAVKGKIVLGILPDEEILKRAKQSDTSKISVLSIVEEFEFKPFKWTTKAGNEMEFTPFVKEEGGKLKKSASVDGEWKHLESPDYRPVRGDENSPFKIIDDGADFIDARMQAGDTIYVHCKSGKGRSATLVAAYLMKHRGLTLDEAVELIKSQRSSVSINKKLFGEHYPNLKEYEKVLQARKAQNSFL